MIHYYFHKRKIDFGDLSKQKKTYYHKSFSLRYSSFDQLLWSLLPVRFQPSYSTKFMKKRSISLNGTKNLLTLTGTEVFMQLWE